MSRPVELGVTAAVAAATPSGLTAIEARRRLGADGPNRLPTTPPPPWWQFLGAQLTHFFALMLWAASVLALVAGTPQLAVAIAVVVVVNGVFAFVQERRAEQAASRLRALLPNRAVVVRDGVRTTVEATELVRGDVVVLAPGDRISADLGVHEAHGLLIDTSLLTGESVPVAVAAGASALAGTFVVEGEGAGVVVATGAYTRLAGIARLATTQRRPPSPLARELHRVVSAVARIAIVVGLVFFALALVLGIEPAAGFIFAVGVTVALVPEGLLPTVTLSLAMGGQRMADRHALVRRLESVETLGSTTVICTDKTGTLTRNEMAVVEVWVPAGLVQVAGVGYEPTATVEGPASARNQAVALSRAARRCSSGRIREVAGRWWPEGDPMEAAIDALHARLGAAVDDSVAGEATVRSVPFDARRKRQSVVTRRSVYVKGAPEATLAACRAVPPAAEERLASWTAQGRRCLAVAVRGREPGDEQRPVDELERGPSSWACSPSRTRRARRRRAPSPVCAAPASRSPCSPATTRPRPGRSPRRPAWHGPTPRCSSAPTCPRTTMPWPSSSSTAR